MACPTRVGGSVNTFLNPLEVGVSSMLMESEIADSSGHLVVPERIDVSLGRPEENGGKYD